MKKQYFAIAASLLLSLSMGSIAMAQDTPTSAKNNTEAKAVSTEISTTPVPYRPDVKVEKPTQDGTYAYHYACTVTGVDAGSSLNVRSKPSTSGTIIGSFAAGAGIFCEFTGEHDVPDGWWYAHGKDKNSGKTIYGYVSADYVTCSNGRIAHTENVMDNFDLLQH